MLERARAEIHKMRTANRGVEMDKSLLTDDELYAICEQELRQLERLKKINLHGSGLWSQAWEQLRAARAVIESRNPLYFDADGRMFGATA